MNNVNFRPGNTVINNAYSIEVKLDAYGIYLIGVGKQHEKGSLFSHVELVGERLLLLGFETDTRSIYGISKNICYKGDFYLTIKDGRFYYDWMGGSVEVKYLHHLENIYMDLTKKVLV